MLALLAASVVQLVISSLVKGMSEQELEDQEEDMWIKNFSSAPSLNNIEITNYSYYEPRFNGVFSINNLARIKDWAYISMIKKVNEHIGFHYRNTEWNFRIEDIPQEVLNQVRNKSITHNILEYKIMKLLCVDFIVSLS